MMSTARFLVPALSVVLIATGCGVATDDASAAPPASAPAPATPAPPSTAPVPARPVDATGSHETWSTAPVTVTHHPAVPPVPVVTGIRYAAHSQERFDRFVVDIPGVLPGYSARYVAEVRADGSGRPIRVPGSAYLLIVLTPAQAHRDDGTATISGVHTVGLPVIRSYAVAGDYEGHVSVALGLNAKAGYHIAELHGRIYVDVAA
jgi:hypothetical protein